MYQREDNRRGFCLTNCSQTINFNCLPFISDPPSQWNVSKWKHQTKNNANIYEVDESLIRRLFLIDSQFFGINYNKRIKLIVFSTHVIIETL